MGLEKAIASGQEHRRPHHGAKAVCFNCRNHGTCDYCKGNRLYGARKRKAAADARQDEYETYNCGGENSAAETTRQSCSCSCACRSNLRNRLAGIQPSVGHERFRQLPC